MLYRTRIKNLTAAYPKLSRVWFKTGNPRMPLKSVWIDEAKLHAVADEFSGSECESAERTEDHLALAV